MGVQGLGVKFRFRGSGFRVSGFGCGVRGLELRVSGSGLRVKVFDVVYVGRVSNDLGWLVFKGFMLVGFWRV